MLLEEPVQLAIWQALNNYCYKDAVFLSERLYAEAPSDETLHLLATSYYRCGSVKRAHALLQKHSPVNIHCKFLMAKCCDEMKRYSEVEHLLVGSIGTLFTSKVTDNIMSEYGNLAGYALQLLGNVYRRSDQLSKAAECYKASLRSNPFLWTSFESLCQMGEKVDPQDYFKTSISSTKPGDGIPYPPKISYGLAAKQHAILSQSRSNCQYDVMSSENLDPSYESSMTSAPLMTSTVVSKPTQNQLSKSSVDNDMAQATTATSREQVRSKVGRNLLGAAATNSPLTPSFGVLPQDTPQAEALSSDFITPSPTTITESRIPSAPAKKHALKRVEGRTTRSGFTGIAPGPSKMQNVGSSTPTLMTPSPTTTSIGISNIGLRRSSRLFGNATGTHSSSKEPKKPSKVQFSESAKTTSNTRRTKTRRTRISMPQPLTPATENIQPGLTPQNEEDVEAKEGVKIDRFSISPIKTSTDGLMQLLQEIGKAYAALASFDCKKAVALFEALPPHQLNTCWVLQQIGTAYFEMTDYHQAEQKFSELRTLDKFHMGGMDVYSTLLWFMKKEGSLSSVALDLVELDRSSPEAWCAMGNCFSLQKEHDSAIKFLQRSIQLDPDFTYAYTLLGHEYVLTEELDKGMSCFRTSIRLDSRHYNAWYGIAMICYKQENYHIAEKHFLRSLQINPKHSVLLCHLAVTQHAMKKPHQALKTVNKALHFMPKNALCKYHKASFLYTLDRYEEALGELEELRKIVPREALVYFLFGKIYRKLGQVHLAQMNFSWAMSLDPQGANSMIKEARYIQEEDDDFNPPPFTLDDTQTSMDQDEDMSELDAHEETELNDSSNSNSFV
ncbi:cell division cycle protein 27 homolog isoform X2 [Rhopilema esculentum]|uniref:cell division cycle protein 27 homolog isoform X2 n=1 Tax=Rhopilema esculentum TaxID=499914 RepID=UPI0031DEE581